MRSGSVSARVARIDSGYECFVVDSGNLGDECFVGFGAHDVFIVLTNQLRSSGGWRVELVSTERTDRVKCVTAECRVSFVTPVVSDVPSLTGRFDDLLAIPPLAPS